MTAPERRRPVSGKGEREMGIEPIKSTRIYEAIVRQVKAMIAEGRLKSGDQLPPERDLAEKFVVSRTSVREALRALESLGLIEIRPGEGTFVREVSVESLIEPLALLMLSQREAIGELFEARRLLEPSIAARIRQWLSCERFGGPGVLSDSSRLWVRRSMIPCTSRLIARL